MDSTEGSVCHYENNIMLVRKRCGGDLIFKGKWLLQ
jgi:hypothetical protein